MAAVFKREFRSYFTSMLGWLFLAVNIFFTGWYFRFYGMVQGYPYISYIITGSLLIFLFSIPILTMRTFAEELRNKTDQLLFTAPVPVWKIVAGKYLAVACVFGIAVLVIGLYPLILSIYGKVPMGENYLALLGFLFFGLTCLAIGVFVSSLTDNPIISAVMTFFVLLLGVMMSGISALISENGNWLTSILSVFDLSKHLDYFLYGKLYLPSFIYYLSVIGICFYLTVFVLSKKRWKVSTHGVGKLVSNVSISAVIVILIAGVNILIGMIPEESVTKDLTYNSIYSLTKETKTMLDEMDEDITLYVLAEKSALDSTLDNTMALMADYSEHIRVEYISPSLNPNFYTQYSESQPTDNSVIVVCGDNYTIVDYYECYQMEYQYAIDYTTGSYQVTGYDITGYDGEGKLLSAIMYVSTEEIPKIYCITGHDELELETELASLLSKANYEVETINLLTYEGVPEDASCIFMLGPLSDYSEEEAEKITSYLEKGGNAILVVAYTDAEELPQYYSVLEPYGITVYPGLVMETGTSFYNSYQYLLLPEIVNLPITQGVYSSMRNKYIYMPYSKGLKLQDAGGVSAETFLKTTENAYAMKDISGDGEKGPEDEGGPFSLGIYAERTLQEGVSKIAVFASDYFLYSDMNSVVNGNNYTLFMNALNKVTGHEEKTIIPVKAYEYDPIIMNEIARIAFSILMIVILPLSLVFSGINTWYYRRKR